MHLEPSEKREGEIAVYEMENDVGCVIAACVETPKCTVNEEREPEERPIGGPGVAEEGGCEVNRVQEKTVYEGAPGGEIWIVHDLLEIVVDKWGGEASPVEDQDEDA
jgi:hypothetical protein